jgi:hypothetical protein
MDAKDMGCGDVRSAKEDWRGSRRRPEPEGSATKKSKRMQQQAKKKHRMDRKER